MKNPFFFTSQINDEAFTNLISAVSSGCNSFYLDSSGGAYSIASAMSQVLEDVPESKLYAVGRVFSVALPIFLFTRVEREVVTNVIGMFHMSSLTYQLASKGRAVTDYDKFLEEEVKYMKNADEWFLDTFFTRMEKEHVLDGKDYYFSHKRLNEMLIEADNQKLSWKDWENAERR